LMNLGKAQAELRHAGTAAGIGEEVNIQWTSMYSDWVTVLKKYP
jgi:hypothetical protein